MSCRAPGTCRCKDLARACREREGDDGAKQRSADGESLMAGGSRDGGEAKRWRFLSRWCAREREIESGGRGREWRQQQGNT
jgi:hypothetical protein